MKIQSALLASAAWTLASLAPSLSTDGMAELADPPNASHYVTAPVEQAEVVRTVVATGALNANVNVEVGSQLSGQIKGVLVDFNDFVHKGQVLAQLDEGSYRAQYDASEASLESARAEVRIAEAKLKRASADQGQAEGQKAVLSARLDEVRIAADNALKTAKRKTQLSSTGIVSAVDAQETTARSDVASASVSEAQAVLDAQAQVEAGARADYLRAGAELEVAESAVKRLEAQLELARIDLERTRIRSPIDGVIVGRNVNEGQTLASTLEARTLFVVAADLRSMEVYARVDESDISQIAPGQPAQFTVDAFPGRTFEATVKQVRKAPVLVQNVVTYVVVLTAPNADLALLPGMTAVTRIETARATASLSVPLAALRYRPRVASGLREKPTTSPEIWVLRAGAPTKVRVRWAPRMGIGRRCSRGTSGRETSSSPESVAPPGRAKADDARSGDAGRALLWRPSQRLCAQAYFHRNRARRVCRSSGRRAPASRR